MGYIEVVHRRRTDNAITNRKRLNEMFGDTKRAIKIIQSKDSQAIKGQKERYQKDDQNPEIKEGQTIQGQNEKF